MEGNLISDEDREIIETLLSEHEYQACWMDHFPWTVAYPDPTFPMPGTPRYVEFRKHLRGYPKEAARVLETIRNFRNPSPPLPIDNKKQIANFSANDSLARQTLYCLLEEINHATIVTSLTDGNTAQAVDIVEARLTSANVYCYFVCKIDTTDRVRAELEGAKKAEQLIDPKYRPHTIGTHKIADTDYSVIAFKFTSESNTTSTPPLSLSKFLQNSTQESVTQLFRQLDQGTLSSMYQNSVSRHTSARSILDTFDRERAGTVGATPYSDGIAEGIQKLIAKGTVLISTSHNLTINCDGQEFPLPVEFLEGNIRFSSDVFEYAAVYPAHGDFNPRNILVTDFENEKLPVLIDFERFGRDPSVALALDFARLEAGLIVGEGLGDTSTQIGIPSWIQEITRSLCAGTMNIIPTCPRTQAIASIRTLYNSRLVPRINGTRSYSIFLGIHMLSYLRPNYEKMLTENQRLQALYVGSHLLAQQ